MDNIGK